MIKWSLTAHILSHSAAVHNRLGTKRKFDENESHQHFTLSIDRAQMIQLGCKNQKDIDSILEAFMHNLLSHKKTYREVKGKSKTIACKK